MATMEMDLETAHERCHALLDEIEQAVIADRELFELVLLGMLARGHVLMEDVPGTGKTLTARSFATALGASFSRIQFTPDLLPTDVTGTHIFNEEERDFEFHPGPIFANVVLADEINRAPPKTQAAMLEAMEEQQVTVENETRELPQPFLVIATQNPIEQEGTFPLPEAQIDRFLIKTEIGYPDVDGYSELLTRRSGREEQMPSVDQVFDPEEITAMQRIPETMIHVDPDLIDYMADIAVATGVDRRVSVGISPRGAQRLFEATRARAVLAGRDYVTPEDIHTIAKPVLAHRLVLTAESRVQNVSKGDIIGETLEELPVPNIQ